MHSSFALNRRYFFGSVAFLILTSSIWYFGDLTPFNNSVTTFFILSFGGLTLILGTLALVSVNLKEIQRWQKESALARGYGSLIGKLLATSDACDKQDVTRTFVQFVSEDPERLLELVKFTGNQKEGLINFCHSEIHRDQLGVSCLTPDNTEESRWMFYQATRNSTHMFERLDKVIGVLKSK